MGHSSLFERRLERRGSLYRDKERRHWNQPLLKHWARSKFGKNSQLNALLAVFADPQVCGLRVTRYRNDNRFPFKTIALANRLSSEKIKISSARGFPPTALICLGLARLDLTRLCKFRQVEDGFRFLSRASLFLLSAFTKPDVYF